jgi:hypothetical protein
MAYGKTWDEWTGSPEQKEEWANFLLSVELADCQDSELLEKIYRTWRSGTNAGWHAGRKAQREDGDGKHFGLGPGQRGTPYSVEEARLALEQLPDEYHRDMYLKLIEAYERQICGRV